MTTTKQPKNMITILVGVVLILFGGIALAYSTVHNSPGPLPEPLSTETVTENRSLTLADEFREIIGDKGNVIVSEDYHIVQIPYPTVTDETETLKLITRLLFAAKLNPPRAVFVQFIDGTDALGEPYIRLSVMYGKFYIEQIDIETFDYRTVFESPLAFISKK